MDGTRYTRRQIIEILRSIRPTPTSSADYIFESFGPQLVVYRKPPGDETQMIAVTAKDLSESVIEGMAVNLFRLWLSSRNYSADQRAAIDNAIRSYPLDMYTLVLLLYSRSPQKLFKALIDGSFYTDICSVLNPDEIEQLTQVLLPLMITAKEEITELLRKILRGKTLGQKRKPAGKKKRR